MISNDFINYFFGKVNKVIASVLFFDITFFFTDFVKLFFVSLWCIVGVLFLIHQFRPIKAVVKPNMPGWLTMGIFAFAIYFIPDEVNFPLVVMWLIMGALFFTFYFKFINVKGLKHSIDITRGKFDHPETVGEVSHFKALATALSATVGLGNIAGVAIAIAMGGPGATFWMILAGFLGMSSKFTECSLAMIYRKKRKNGEIMGGAMIYLSEGLAEIGKAKFGKTLAILFSLFAIGGSFGGGGAFQVNQSLHAISESVPFFNHYPWVYGLIMSLLVGIVIIGGIRRIAGVAERIVPLMCGVYVITCLFILITFISDIPNAFGLIIKGAFSPEAMYGGFWGVLIMGFKRAAFSNEAGVGSAAIAHSAAKSQYPIQEGFVALLEPFIDTIVICTMTALVIIITGAYNNPDYAQWIHSNEGAALTSKAMGEVVPWFGYVLSLSVFLFAFSTIISWSYYGERCFSYVFGDKHSLIFKISLCVVVYLGSITTADNVLEFGDLMILGMAFPNILGLYFLVFKVRGELNDYLERLKQGKIQPNS